MKKEIVFRGKSICTKKWVYGAHMVIRGVHFILEVGEKHTINQHKVIAKSVGMSFGELDKAGKWMFEGDIVDGVMLAGGGGSRKSGKECRFILQFSNDRVWAGWWLKEIDKIKGDYRGLPGHNLLTVIGNVTDNPEMLEPITR